jgi:hypothetical protein
VHLLVEIIRTAPSRGRPRFLLLTDQERPAEQFPDATDEQPPTARISFPMERPR